MQAPPHKGNAVKPGWGDGVPRDDHASACAPVLQRNARSTQALITVAEIAKSHSSKLRVSLSSWRGSNKVEIRDCTAVIADCSFPTGAGVTLDIDKLPELIAALRRAEAQAVTMGLLKGRPAA